METLIYQGEDLFDKLSEACQCEMIERDLALEVEYYDIGEREYRVRWAGFINEDGEEVELHDIDPINEAASAVC